MISRRHLFKATAAAFGVGNVAVFRAKDATSGLQAVVQEIKAPSFPDRDFDITHFGAVGDGEKKCTDAIRKAIAACELARGGRVIVPAGKFLTGAIHLANNVNLHVSEGATLLFSRDPKDYLPLVFTRFEGTECMNYSPFIYVFEKTNVGVTGSGLLDGQAGTEYWWPWAGKARGGWKKGDPNAESDRKIIVSMGDRNVPVEQRIFGEGHYLRPNFVQPYGCANVLLEGFSMKNSPMWELNPVLCRNVTVRGINIDSRGPNNDGCDPECCDGVLIARCTFSTGDDCIAIKAGRNQDGRRVNVPCQNIVVRDCIMKDGHGGVSIGSEVSGGIRNIFVDHCRMSSPNLQRALRIKTNSYRGGVIDNVSFRDVTVGEVAEAAIEVDFFYEEGEGGPFRPIVRNIDVANIRCLKSKYAIYLRGYKQTPISGISISHCTFNDAAKGVFVENTESANLTDVTVNGQPYNLPHA
jgi:polygalacturonase